MLTFCRQAGRALLDLVYPGACIGCGAALSGATWCPTCRANLAPIGDTRCPKCGFPLGPHAHGRAACAHCRDAGPFRQAVGVYRYEDPLRAALHRWKYRGDLRAGRVLRDAMAAAIGRESFAPQVEIVVPVPLHWRRRFRRRFNQAEYLARGVAETLGVHCGGRVLRRTRHTPSQVGLMPVQRRDNVRGAFEVRRPDIVRGRTVLLVDDVLTTCATVGECARALRAAGAKRVYVAGLARWSGAELGKPNP